MSNIIEKLGIKNIELYSAYYVNGEEVRKLEQQRNEMLEILISVAGFLENEKRGKWDVTNIIEKVTGKNWNEIKELSNE